MDANTSSVAATIGSWIGAWTAMIAIGAIPGLLPLIVGFKKGKRSLAIGGFLACVITAFLYGFASIISCIVFTVLILIGKKKQTHYTTQ